MSGIWSVFQRPTPDQASPHRPPGPPEGVLAWVRRAVGWPGPKRAEGTAADTFVVEERARAGPPGIVFPWFLPYFDEGQTAGENQAMRLAYRRMVADPNVKAALYGKIQAVSNLTLKVIPSDRKDPRQAEVAEFVRWNLEDGLEGGMPDLAWAVLTGGLIDGHSLCEKVFAREDRGKHAGKFYLRALKPKDVTKDVILLTDEFRNVVGVQGLRYNPGVTFDPSKFVYYRHQPLYDNPTGMSDLRAVYSRYWFLDTILKLRAVGLEKRALPVVMGEYQHAQQRPAVEEALSVVKSQNWLAVPEGVKVQALNIAGSADSAFSDACRQLAEDIFLGIAGATLQARQGDVNNARGSSQVHRNTADLFIDHLRVKLMQILNDRRNGLVRDIVDLNYLTDEYPKATLAAVDERDLAGELEVDRGLWEIGVKQSLSAIYERYNREPPDASEPQDSLGGKADQEAQVAAATIAAPAGPGMEAASDMVLTDDTRANAPQNQSMTGPMPGMGGATEGGAEQMAEGEGEDDADIPERVGWSPDLSSPPTPVRDVVFHGSPRTDLKAVSADPPDRQFDNGTSQLGAFFSPDEEGGKNYAGDSGKVYPARANLQKAFDLPFRVFSYLQDPTKDREGKPLPSDQWERRFGELKREARALRRRLQEAGYDGIIVRGHRGKIKEIASFLDVPLEPEPPASDMAESIRGGWNDGQGIDAPISNGAGVDSLGRLYGVAAGNRVSLKRPLPARHGVGGGPRKMAEPEEVGAPPGARLRPEDATRPAPEPEPPPLAGTRPDPDAAPEPDRRATLRRPDREGTPRQPFDGPPGRTLEPGEARADATRRERDDADRRRDLYESQTLPRAGGSHVESLTDDDLSQARYVAPENAGRTVNQGVLGEVIVGGRVAFYKGVGGHKAANERAASALLRYAGVGAPAVRHARVPGAPEEEAGAGGLVMEHVGGEDLTAVFDRAERLLPQGASTSRVDEAIREAGREVRSRLRPGELDRAVAVSLLLGVNDRHLGNWMIAGDRLVSVDHEFAFWGGVTPSREYGPLDPRGLRANALLVLLPEGQPLDRGELSRAAALAPRLARLAERERPGSGRWVELIGKAIADAAADRRPSVASLERSLRAVRADVAGTDRPHPGWWKEAAT